MAVAKVCIDAAPKQSVSQCAYFFPVIFADGVVSLSFLLQPLLVEGLMDTVAPLTDEELATYANIDFDPEEYRKDLVASELIHGEDKAKTLMARYRSRPYCERNKNSHKNTICAGGVIRPYHSME